MKGLIPEAVYHYRLVSTNSLGTSYGIDKTFTTEAGNPSIDVGGGSSSSSGGGGCFIDSASQ